MGLVLRAVEVAGPHQWRWLLLDEASGAPLAEHIHHAGLGLWTQLSGQGHRLQILGLLGQHEQVLTDLAVLRTRMANLHDHHADNENMYPWGVREPILGVAGLSALALGRWAQALDLYDELAASQRRRGASLAHYLSRAAGSPAHRLGSAFLRLLIGDTHALTGALHALAGDLHRDIEYLDPPVLPTTLPEVIGLVDAGDGVHFGSLVAALLPRHRRPCPGRPPGHRRDPSRVTK